MDPPLKRIHLMGMDVPKVEVNGFKVCQVQRDGGKERWFSHRGVWFDSWKEETERYTLYEVPFFAKRCKSLQIFSEHAEAKKFIEPFKERQAKLRAADTGKAGVADEGED